MRTVILFLFAMRCIPMLAQGSDGATALTFSRSVSVPLNGVQLYDKTLDALNWTFGKEPGAKLVLADRGSGTLEMSARVNFRSVMLTGREETMGTILYTVHVQVNAGEMRVVVSGLTHTGNRNTARGGIHVGPLMRVDTDARQTSGLGRTNVVRLHAELRQVASERINTLLQALEARVRANAEP